MKKLLPLCLLLLLASPCLAEMISVIHQPAELRDRAMVSGSKVIRQLPRYTPLEVLGRHSNYFQVKNAEGKVGYIHQSLTKQTPSVTVTASSCNIRSGPGTEFSIVSRANKGDSFQVLSQEQEWIQILTEAGQIGWIWQNLVWGL
jgi:uncharacterized protein YgiM (DUF1202 family)